MKVSASEGDWAVLKGVRTPLASGGLGIALISLWALSSGVFLPAVLPAMTWEVSAPLITPTQRGNDPEIAVKDPSVVHYSDKWHVFMTVIHASGTRHIQYMSFDSWDVASDAPRYQLDLREGYVGAPQVFYFRPQEKWYLIYQVEAPNRLWSQPAYSTTSRIADPTSWTEAELFFPDADPTGREGMALDFWIIADEQSVYLFYTSLNGKLFRMRTSIEDFPHGFDNLELALEDDFLEASHTYRLKDLDAYLTIVEAGHQGKRFYKAYTAKRLEGRLRPLADSEAKSFAGAANVKAADGIGLWVDNVSHGELLRDGFDETLDVDPERLRFLFQGVMERDKPPGDYDNIPWRIGLLKRASE